MLIKFGGEKGNHRQSHVWEQMHRAEQGASLPGEEVGKKDTVGQRVKVSCLMSIAFSNRDISFSYFESSGLEKLEISLHSPHFSLRYFP